MPENSKFRYYFERIKSLIPEQANKSFETALNHQHAKKIIGAVGLLLLAFWVFSGPSMPTEAQIYKMIAVEEEERDKDGSIVLDKFTVDYCELVENERRMKVSKCVVTYDKIVTFNSFGGKRGSKTRIPESTETYHFWQDENGQWKMKYLY